MKLRSLKETNRKFVNNERGRTNFTIEEDNFIKENYLKYPLKKLGNLLNRSGCGIQGRLNHYNLIIPEELIEQRKRDSQKKPGCIPLNKGMKQIEYMSPEQIEKTKATRFKKGQIPHNARGVKNGDIRIRTNHLQRGGKQYKWIRISMGHWEMLHHFVWEQIYGPRPEASILRFKDSDQMNCSIENLELIDMKTNMLLNSIQRFPDELQQSMRLLSKLNKTINNIQNG